MDTLSHDVRYAVRTFFKQPALSATMVVTLALGIGANTAVFSVVHAVLLRDLPYPDPARLVMLSEKRPAEGRMTGPVSPADFLDWSNLNHSFTAIAAFSPDRVDLTGSGDPLQASAGTVTAEFFDVLSVHPLYGRTFNRDEDVSGRHRVVVLGHAIWQQRFGGSPSAIGQTVLLNGVAHEIIGVLPRDFESPAPALGQAPLGSPDVWLPLAIRGGNDAPTRTIHFLFVYGRLKAGVRLEEARSEMDAVGRQLEALHPAENRGHGANVSSLRDQIVSPVQRGLVVLAAAVAFVLLIACTNVANLLLARAAGRRRELAIRIAVGAARGRLLRQALTESLVVAMLSGLVGLGGAFLMLQVLVAETPPVLRGVGLDRASLNSTVLGFTLLVCIATGVIAGLLPAWRASREDPGEPLREGGRAPASLPKRVRMTLIAAEVALTSVLLVGAGLMLHSFERVISQPSGIEIDHRLTATVTLARSRYGDVDRLRRARYEIERRLRGIPGVIAAGSTNMLPLTGADRRGGITIEGLETREDDAPTRAHPRVVTPDYFRAVGIRVTAGRPFSEDDNALAPRVAIVNETMARRYWPASSPLGQRVRFNAVQEPWRQIVGVIADVRHWGLDREVNPEVYLPFDQEPGAVLNFVLHTTVDPVQVVAPVTRAVHEFDPNLPLGNTRPLEDVAARSIAARRWSAVLLGSFAFVAIVLAGVGIYGVMSQLVSSRTSEIGIRLALGARPARVLRQLVGEGLMHTVVGLGLGLTASLLVTRGLQGLLYEINPADPAAMVFAAATLLLIALVACIVPARRAMRIDPVVALRFE